MATIVLAHGAWSSAWAWRKMRPLMAAVGHRFFTPSYTGLGERAHLASPSNDLETHIQDVLGVVTFEDLRRPPRRRSDRPQLRRHGGHGRRRSRAIGWQSSSISTPSCRRTARPCWIFWRQRSDDACWKVWRQATAGASRRIRSRPTPLRRTWSGSRNSACRSRSDVSNSLSACRANRRFHKYTFTARGTSTRVRSVNSRSAPGAKLDDRSAS